MMMNSMEANFFVLFQMKYWIFFPSYLCHSSPAIRIQIIIKYKTNHKYILFFEGKKEMKWNACAYCGITNPLRMHECWEMIWSRAKEIIFWEHINPLNFEWLRIRRAHSSPTNCSSIHKLLLQKAGGYKWKKKTIWFVMSWNTFCEIKSKLASAYLKNPSNSAKSWTTLSQMVGIVGLLFRVNIDGSTIMVTGYPEQISNYPF